MLKHILLVSLLSFSTLPLLKAQSCGNDEKYHLPYKNTYVKEPLVTENEYRVAKPETIVPKSFEEARQILPNPIWGGHDKELEMYWKAWEIAIGNIRAPQAGSGFVSSYLDTAYNGNIFMWDSSFILMFARYGTRTILGEMEPTGQADGGPAWIICPVFRRNTALSTVTGI